jgi:GDP-L-fucose synthase
MDKNSKIFVAGGRGMVGSAIIRELTLNGFRNITAPNSQELNLINQYEVEKFFDKEQPEYVFLAAAKVGGIIANNTYPADFLYVNLMIESNIIHNAYTHQVKKLLFLGSSCIYPKYAEQPILEDSLLTGVLESTNEAYAIAKIAGIELCKFYRRQYGCDFISAMPTNLYGINDNFDLQNAHVLPAMIRKFHEAKINQSSTYTLWGTGTPKREFLYVDDLAVACLFLMMTYSEETHVNIGTGKDLTVKELAHIVKDIIGYDGEITHDLSKPDGTPRKVLNVDKINNLGWKAKIELEEGIRRVYKWYLEQN